MQVGEQSGCRFFAFRDEHHVVELFGGLNFEPKRDQDAHVCRFGVSTRPLKDRPCVRVVAYVVGGVNLEFATLASGYFREVGFNKEGIVVLCFFDAFTLRFF